MDEDERLFKEANICWPVPEAVPRYDAVGHMFNPDTLICAFCQCGIDNSTVICPKRTNKENKTELDTPTSFFSDYERKSGHKAYICPNDCSNIGCMFCQGGLFMCTQCNSHEGATTTDCPDYLMDMVIIDHVYARLLDFRNGRWIHLPGIIEFIKENKA